MLSVEILTDFMLAALKCSLLCFRKLNKYGACTYTMQNVHSYACLKLLKGIFTDKPYKIADILNSHFAEILNVSEMCPRMF